MLEPGQTWRNRAGAFVTVEYKASQRSWYMRHETNHELTGYLVDAKGQPTMREQPELALMERAERVYISVHPSITDRSAEAAREHYRKRGCWVTSTSPEDQRESLRELLGCEIFVLMPGYINYDFSDVELGIAEALHMTIVYPEV